MDPSLVSVIVPVFNGERYIGATLDSALLQTHRNIEVIVVDDGSTDRTRAIVQARGARDSRVRLVAQANAGVAAARNRAIAESRGAFIAPLDADDVWEPTKIKRQVRRMHEGGSDTGLVYTWWMWIDEEGAVVDCSPRWRIEGSCADLLLEVNFIGSASIPLFRRRVLEELGGYDESLPTGCEDWDLALRVAERARVAVVPARLVGYRTRRNSMSSDAAAMWQSLRRVIDRASSRRPDLSRGAIRRSHGQSALYIAGVSFFSGRYGRALAWGLRALRSRTAYEILPYIVSRVAPTLWRTRQARRRIVSPGAHFGEWSLPDARIPYDRIYDRRLRAALSRR